MDIFLILVLMAGALFGAGWFSPNWLYWAASRMIARGDALKTMRAHYKVRRSEWDEHLGVQDLRKL